MIERKDDREKNSTRRRSNQNLTRDKISQGELIDRINHGRYLIKRRLEFRSKTWGVFLKKNWNISTGEANIRMRIVKRLAYNDETMNRLVVADLPWDIVKRLSLKYVTDEMIDQFFGQVEMIADRNTSNCRNLLNKIKVEHGLIDQMTWIDEQEEEEIEEDIAVDDDTSPEMQMQEIPLTSFVTKSQKKEQALAQIKENFLNLMNSVEGLLALQAD